ncbi:MAG: response regulator [Lachnospiraceae bacterium]|nr:response regulator [Lachnospiraceae bacterium]
MPNRFGETLKNLRAEKNLSQQQLAQKLFVNRSSVANWETGRRIPDLILLTRLAQILNVDISVLTNSANDDLAPPEVIVVDDESILLTGAIPVLSEAMPQASITGFLRASEAIDFALDKQISVAFLDIEIGKSSGIDLCKTLMDINPLTNVIFVTSYPDYAVDAWTTTASGFLVKPVNLRDVKEQIGKLRYPVRGLS